MWSAEVNNYKYFGTEGVYMFQLYIYNQQMQISCGEVKKIPGPSG
jgi:hypothetical protein